jgi:hypothetical protein
MFFKNQPTMRLICVFACVAVIATIAATGGAVAQDVPGITINESNVTTDEQTTYAQEIDEDTRLVDWEYDEDREGFILVFETDSRTTMTLTEAVQFDEGAGGGRIYQQRLPAGMTEIFVSVPTRAGQAALTMTTPGSIANNRYSYVSTGVSQFGGEPISYGRVQLLVILTGLCVSGATVGIMRNRRDNDDKQYKRVL